MKREVILGQDDAVGGFVARMNGGEWTPMRGRAIGLAENGNLIAGVIYENFNHRSVVTHIAAIQDRRWMTREFLWAIFAYPFNQLGVQKLIAPVGPANVRSRRFISNLGFVLETALKDAHPDGDLLFYTMSRDSDRAQKWLNIRRVQNGQIVSTAAAGLSGDGAGAGSSES